MTAAVAERLPRRDDWQTPRVIFDQLYSEYRFTLDAAADRDNALCPMHYSEERSGLRGSWVGHTVWCNPPYKAIFPWVKKALVEADANGVFSYLLLPASSDTGWFQLALTQAQVHLFAGRIRFSDPTGASRSTPKQPNCLVVVDPHSIRVGVTAARSSKTGQIIWRAP